MRYVTPCENLGLRKIRGVEHKCTVFVMHPGLAFKIDDEKREYPVVHVQPEMIRHIEYTFTLRWLDGRTVAVFKTKDGTEYAQPVIDDPRAKREERKRERLKHAEEKVQAPEPERAALERPRPRKQPKARRPLTLEPL